MSIKTMVLMHIGGRKTYDYWSTVHGRNSYDNLGAAIKAMYFDVDYDNAYWNGSVIW
jgi:Zn-dependent metalloprotease